MFKGWRGLVYGLLIGAIVGGGLVYFLAPPRRSSAQEPEGKSALSALECAQAVVKAFNARDFSAVSRWAHPDKGVTFVPYSTVEPGKNLVFAADKLAQFATDKTSYVWGETDGEGAPIQMTPVEYCKVYVTDRNYLEAPQTGVNTLLGRGNALENVRETYPDATVVELYYPGVDPQWEGLDWSSLKLVFEKVGDGLRLVAVIHGQWTV